jgi:16S rRNA (cytidine1402-2'-O)-methyltransferase
MNQVNQSNTATVYLIPTVLSEGATEVLPGYLLQAIRQCKVLFVENERTARRFLKLLDKQIVIDDFQWHAIGELKNEVLVDFRNAVRTGKTIGIISEAGCPGIADPGQELVAIAQSLHATVKPLVGPNSILLALMASGMNGQHFQFLGYLPIDASERLQSLKKIESESRNKNCTQIFIETPYRNNQMLETILKPCEPKTRLCIAVDITAPAEMIQTKTISEWKQAKPELHKRPAIFLIYAASER